MNRSKQSTHIIEFGIYTGLSWDKLSLEYLHGLADMGNDQAIKQLESIYNLPIQEQRIGFGKYTNSLWVDLELDYLYWLLENIEPSNIKHTLATKAFNYIVKHRDNNDLEVIYVD